jgi:hypothetical protein
VLLQLRPGVHFRERRTFALGRAMS